MKKHEQVIQISRLGEEDIFGLVSLSHSVGWDYDEAEIRTILSAGIIYGHKNEAGEIISSAAILPYDKTLASIGMVIVDDNYRGKRLGWEITEACIRSVPDDTTIMLIATQAGRPLYEKLGFQAVSSVHKYLYEIEAPVAYKTEKIAFEISPLTEFHFGKVKELDKAAVGSDRENLLRSRIRQAKEAIVVTDKSGEIVGYGLGIEGPEYFVLGPIIAPTNDVAIAIIEQLAACYHGKLRIDVPDGQASFMDYLEKSGFTKVSQPPIMVKNADQIPTRNNTLYGIAAQIFG